MPKKKEWWQLAADRAKKDKAKGVIVTFKIDSSPQRAKRKAKKAARSIRKANRALVFGWKPKRK